jgi:methyltransferase
VIAYVALLALIALERLAELRRSRRNAAWALERGGIELGRRHFRAMVVAHALFLPACALEVWMLDRPFVPALGWPMLGLVVLAQALRAWVVATLGRRWNVRTIVIPGEPVVAGGPYRFVRHPNYVAVILEAFAVPLVHSAWLTAIVFTAVNVPLLAVRIRCEEDALAFHSDPGRRLDRLPRFIPRARGPR